MKLALVLVTGLPGVGKSTLCQHLSRISSTQRCFLPICFDSLLPTHMFQQIDFSEKHETSAWKKWRNCVLFAVEKIVTDALHIPFNVTHTDDCLCQWKHTLPNVDANVAELFLLLDDNFYYQSMRKQYYILAKSYFIGFGVLYCQAPLDMCISRNTGRRSPVPEHVIQEMAEKLEIPGTSASWERHCLSVSTDSTINDATIEEIMEFFRILLSNPLIDRTDEIEAERERSRVTNELNYRHNLDKRLRQTTSNFLKGHSAEWVKQNISFVLDAKKQCIEAIKSQNVQPELRVDDDLDVVDRLFREKLASLCN